MSQFEFILVRIDEVYEFMFDVSELGVTVDRLGEFDSLVDFYVSVALLLWPASLMLDFFDS